MTNTKSRSERIAEYYIKGSTASTKKTRIKYFNKIIEEIKIAKKSFGYFGFFENEENEIKAHLK